MTSTISLQSLQTQIRKDPASYREDFLLQFRHFESLSDSLHLNPGRPSKQYGDLLHFLSHCYACYRSLHAELGLEGLIYKTLSKEPERLHQTVRRALVQAALLLRSKGAMKFMDNFERLFALNAVEDKEMRKTLFHGLLGDIGNSTVPNKRLPKGENSAINRKAVQSFLVSVLRNSSSAVGLVRAAGGLMLAAFKKKIWRDAAVANAIAEAVVLGQNDPKTITAGVYLLLGNLKQAMRISEACEDMEERQKKKTKKTKKNENDETDEDEEDAAANDKSLVDFSAIDLLNDSQSFTEKLFDKANAKNISFDQRVLLLQLVARLIGRFELLLLNFYSYVQRFLRPNNPGVTKLLAAFTEASHALVPPEELQPVIKHLLEHFVAEHCRPEAVAVGINCLRAMAARAPLALEADQLQYICSFRESKNRTVVGASRAVLNLFRDKFPELLPRKLRGKEAAIAVSAGNAARPTFGKKDAPLDDLPGIRSLRKEHIPDEHDEEEHDEDEEDDVEESSTDECSEDEEEEEVEGDEEDEEAEEEDDDDEEAEEEDSDADEDEEEEEEEAGERGPKISVAAERVLGDEDFKRMRRKRKADDMEASDADSDENEEESSESDGEFRPMDPNALAPRRRDLSAMTKKQARVATIREGKTDKKLFKKKERRGGSTNKEKSRNKPIMMSTQKRKSQKSLMSSTDKAQSLKKHIKNLRKKVGGVQKRRRG